MPNGGKRGIIKTEDKSLWHHRESPMLLLGLPLELYSDDQKRVITELILENTWIVEESNDLIGLSLNQERISTVSDCYNN